MSVLHNIQHTYNYRNTNSSMSELALRNKNKLDFSYIVFKLLQVVHSKCESILVGAIGHPLQHHLIRLYPVTDAQLHH